MAILLLYAVLCGFIIFVVGIIHMKTILSVQLISRKENEHCSYVHAYIHMYILMRIYVYIRQNM